MRKFLLLFLICSAAFGQNINDYKYVVVPSRFVFLKEKDQYRLNSLTKGLLGKYGFTAYLDTDLLPDELVNYNCNKLYVDVSDVGGFVYTKVIIELKDCRNNIIFRSAEGKSKSKEWAVAYNEALRDAFSSFDALHYKYNGTSVGIQGLDGKASSGNGVISSATVPLSDAKSVSAHSIVNGYELVDGKMNSVMKLFVTSSQDLYLAEKGEYKGLLQRKGRIWIFDYYKDGKLVSEPLQISF